MVDLSGASAGGEGYVMDAFVNTSFQSGKKIETYATFTDPSLDKIMLWHEYQSQENPQ